ncbi:MAG: ABC transporter substrate-binding protein [Silicimonas sp.]
MTGSRQKNFNRGLNLDRRRFMASGAGFGLAGALALRGAGAYASDAPDKGGVFRLGMIEGETTDTLDPRTTNTTYMAHINLQLRNCLVEIGPNMSLLPELAEEFQPRDNGKSWAFKIRTGVEFHNGKPLTAEDVVYSINLHRGPDSTSGAKALLDAVTDIRVEDGQWVVFSLENANVDFPYVLADYHLVIVPDGTTDFSDGMGTGGYVLEAFKPGVVTRARRNPNYWKDGRAHFDAVETIAISDATARINALLSDAVDAIIQVGYDAAGPMARKDDLQLIEVPSTQHVVLPMRMDTPPFDNLDLRLALKYAIDREHILEAVLGGHGTLGNDHPIAPVNRYYADDIPMRAYDPEKAKYLLQKSGHDTIDLTLDASDAVLGFGVDLAVLLKESASKAGINVNIRRNPSDGYWSNVWLEKPWFEGFWAGRPTADWMFTQAYAAEAPWNEARWKNPRFNELLVNARAELDEGKRAAMYHEMQLLCRDDAGSIIPIFTNILDAANSRVRYDGLASNLAGDGARCAERWWFA